MKPYKVLALIALLALTLGTANRDADRNRIVAFDISVTDKNGSPVLGLEKQNFRLYEDGVQQSLIEISPAQKPLALVVLMETSDALAYHMPSSMDPAIGLLQSLRSNDWGAVVTFASEPDILSDFTHDKSALLASLRRGQTEFPSDVALYDAIYFVLDRAQELDEKTAILLIATGRDTRSMRRTYAQALRKAETSGAAIYTVALTQPYLQAPSPYPDYKREVKSREAEYTLSSFAEASGGLSFVPQFAAQYSMIHRVIGTDLRNQYTITFASARSETGSKVRKLKVEVVGTDIDHNGKPDRLIVRHKRGH